MTDSRNATDAELATHAAELATRWVSAETPLTQTQGWKLVDLQHPGSGHIEMFVWEDVLAWERELAAALAADDGTEESRERTAQAKDAAASAMRDMLLEGISAGESVNRIRHEGQGPDPREELRRSIATHG